MSALVLWLAFRGTDREAVAAALRAARPLPLLLGFAALGTMYLLQATRWQLIARTPNVGLPLFAGMVVGGVAVNNVLPGRLGDLLRARWLAVEARIPSGRALATVVLDRAGDLIALAILLSVSAWGIAETAWLQRIAIGALLGVVALLAAVVLARLYAARHPTGLVSRGRTRRFVRDAIDGLAQPLGVRVVAAAIALSLAAWLAFSVAVLSIASSVGIELHVVDAIFVAAVVNLGVAIPSSPGFVGTYQWLIVEALALIPAGTREEGLAFAILLQASWYVPTTIAGGVVVLTRLRVRVRHVARLSTP